MPVRRHHLFKNAVFAGGGSRCLWQLGFWLGAREADLDLAGTVSYAASTSAGCAIAAAALLGREREALGRFKVLSAENPSNIHWRNLFRADAPLLPHARMYRGVMQRFLSDPDLAVLREKNLDCLIAANPPGIPGGLAALLGFSIYGLEKRLTHRIHPQWSRRLGFKPVVGSSRDADTVDDLVDMILAASSVPPVLPSPPFRGRAVLDGGMIDNVPAF